MLFFYANPILIAAAVIPAIVLLIQVNKADKLDKEPPGMLLNLVFWGAVSTALAVYTERLGTALLDALWPENSLIYRLLMYFVVVGLSEEGFKYLLLKRHSWNSPFFNCQFDGVVYAVAVALGFALWENIDYVLMYGMGTALVRAITAVPGHACFGVFMGAFYGMAKRYENYGYPGYSKTCRRLAVIVPMILHGIYDFIATSESTNAQWGFLIFVIVLFLITSRMVKKLSSRDQYID